jgi:hypothetical protein
MKPIQYEFEYIDPETQELIEGKMYSSENPINNDPDGEIEDYLYTIADKGFYQFWRV